MLLRNIFESEFSTNMFFYCFFQNKHTLSDPIDFEGFVLKNKMLIQNDPQREMLMYPSDDVSVSFYIII